MAASPQPVQVSSSELSRHNKKDDCWLAVHQKVWDLTDFVDEHPGGADSELTLFRCCYRRKMPL